MPTAAAFLPLLLFKGEAEAVLDQVQRFADAFRRAELATIETLLTDDYSHTNADGSKPRREDWLAWLSRRRGEIDAGRLELTEYRNEGLAVALYGGAAIVTGVNVSTGRRDGTPFHSRLRFTQVWVRREGVWKRAAFHDSHIAP